MVQLNPDVGPHARHAPMASRVVAKVLTVAEQLVVGDRFERLFGQSLTIASATKSQPGGWESFGYDGGSAYFNTDGCDGTAEGFKFSCL